MNGTGGILGRTVKLDVFDVGGDPQQYRSAVTAACTRDFAIVGSTTSADDGGASAASCGIPNLPVRAASTADPAETTYAVFPARPGTELIGGISWLLRNVDGCCRGVAAVPNGPRRLDTAFRLAAASKVGYFAAGTVTVPTGAGAGAAYQRVVHVTSGEGAGLVWSMLDGTSTMALRRSFDATVFAPQVSWLCDEACYSGSFLADGGAAVEGQFVQIPIEPFEDATEIPGLRIYLQQSSQAGVLPSVQGAEMFAAGLLFEDAVTARRTKDAPTRASVLAALANIHDFDADGMIGTTDVGARRPSGCFVLLRVHDAKYERAAPSAPATMSCGVANLATSTP